MSERTTGRPVDIPDLSKLEEHGATIDAPTPTQILMPDPWAQGANGTTTPAGGADPTLSEDTRK